MAVFTCPGNANKAETQLTVINLACQEVLTCLLMCDQLSGDVSALVFFCLIKKGLREGEGPAD